MSFGSTLTADTVGICCAAEEAEFSSLQDVNAKNAAAAANNLFLNNIYFTLSFKLTLA